MAYGTQPILLPRSQITATGMQPLSHTSIQRPIEQQQQQLPANYVAMPSVQVVNSPQFIQTNITVHRNNAPQSVLSPSDSDTIVQKQPVLKNNVLAHSHLVNPARSMETLTGINYMHHQNNNRKHYAGVTYGQFSKVINGPVVSPSLDDSSLPSNVYSPTVTMPCSTPSQKTSTLITTAASVPSHVISQRRCLSESDANEGFNGVQEQFSPKKSQTFQNRPPLIMPAFGNNQVYMIPKFTNCNYQTTISSANTINISDNASPNPIVFTYNSQPQAQQVQQQQNSNRIITDGTLSTQLISPSTMLPLNSTLVTSKEQLKSPIISQGIILSPTKTIPAGANGTYLPSQTLELKGIACIGQIN